eukprot:624113-Ditylum_brightwellii.AAC.1
MIDAKSDDHDPNFNIKYEKAMKDAVEADRDLCNESFQRLKEFLARLSEQKGEEEESKTFKKRKTSLCSLVSITQDFTDDNNVRASRKLSQDKRDYCEDLMKKFRPCDAELVDFAKFFGRYLLASKRRPLCLQRV